MTANKSAKDSSVSVSEIGGTRREHASVSKKDQIAVKSSDFLEAAPDGMVVVGPDGRIRLASGTTRTELPLSGRRVAVTRTRVRRRNGRDEVLPTRARPRAATTRCPAESSTRSAPASRRAANRRRAGTKSRPPQPLISRGQDVAMKSAANNLSTRCDVSKGLAPRRLRVLSGSPTKASSKCSARRFRGALIGADELPQRVR